MREHLTYRIVVLTTGGSVVQTRPAQVAVDRGPNDPPATEMLVTSINEAWGKAARDRTPYVLGLCESHDGLVAVAPDKVEILSVLVDGQPGG